MQGEISPALNNYKQGAISFLKQSGFILRNDGTFQFRDAISYNHEISTGIFLAAHKSEVLGINIEVCKTGDTQATIYIYFNSDSAQRVTDPIVVENIIVAPIGVRFLEVDLTGLLTVNTPSSNIVVFITGLNLNLKYIDSSYTLKDFKINNGGTQPTNTPIVTIVGLMQQRLPLLTDARFIGGATGTISGALITFSKVSKLDFFVVESGTGASAESIAESAFEVVPRQWDEPHEIWGFIVERKQMVVLTSVGLNVCKALDEDTQNITVMNKTYYQIDRAQALPILPVVFANYLTYATTHGLRYRPYSFVSTMYSPQVDPGCFEMPTEAEEVENISDMRIVPYYNVLAVIADGVVYAFHQPKILNEGYAAVYPRTTLFESENLKCICWNNNIQVFQENDSSHVVGFSQREKGYLNVGVSKYEPTLNIDVVNGRQITLTLPYQEYLNKVYIQLNDGVYTLFYRNTPDTFFTDDASTEITIGVFKFFPCKTSDISYFLPTSTLLKPWALIGTVNDIIVNVVQAKDFDLDTYDIYATIDVKYHMYVENAQLRIEADTPPNIQSKLKAIRMHFSEKTYDHFKITPTPSEDQKAGPNDLPRSYPATVASNFTIANNIFNINFTPYNISSHMIFLYRVFPI
jgi:hypothetical protein